MQNLLIEDITTLFVVVDDLLGKRTSGRGRPSLLSASETVTMLIWSTVILEQKKLKDIYRFMSRYHTDDFPHLPNYQNFIKQCHRCIPVMAQLLCLSVDTSAPLRFVDSTMLEVCKLIRAHRHRVAAGIAAFGKNHQGWHYGFKLHAAVAPDRSLCGLRITPANEHDAQQLPYLVRGSTKIAVGDGAYNARVMREKLWHEQGVFVLAPPHPKQNKKLIAAWQLLLLRARPRIESVFDYLKEHMHLVSSFPRSVMGYLLHYLRILLGYQCRGVIG